MKCTVCGLVELMGQQRQYCSKNCERKGWRDKNKDKILAGKKRYREENRDKLALYFKAYKSKVQEVKPSIAKNLKAAYSCLRCGGRLKLEVHHMKSQLLGGEANDLNNLVVLCKDCHARWHKMFNKDYWVIT